MDATIIWDLEDEMDGNVQHLREHDVTIEEAEEVLLDPDSSRTRSHTSGLHGFRLDLDGPAPCGRVRSCGRGSADVEASHGV